MAQEFGVLPHQLLYLDLDEFNFNLAIMYFGTKQEQDLQKEVEKDQTDGTKNKFSSSKGGKQLTQAEFEKSFRVT